MASVMSCSPLPSAARVFNLSDMATVQTRVLLFISGDGIHAKAFVSVLTAVLGVGVVNSRVGVFPLELSVGLEL